MQFSGFNRFRQSYRNRSGTASEIEDAHAGLKIGKQVRRVACDAPALKQLLKIVAVSHYVIGHGIISGFVTVHGSGFFGSSL